MNWKDAGTALVKQGLPLLGTILGGPAGAALGSGVAALVSSALGFTGELSPDDLIASIGNPESVVALKQVEADHKLELQRLIVHSEELKLAAETQRIVAVNQTMQAESKSEHWAQWGWRPAWGFISAAAFLVVTIFVCVLAYRAIVEKDANAIGMIPLLIGAFTALFGVPGAILGITAWGRNKLKNQMVIEGHKDVKHEGAIL